MLEALRDAPPRLVRFPIQLSAVHVPKRALYLSSYLLELRFDVGE